MIWIGREQAIVQYLCLCLRALRALSVVSTPLIEIRCLARHASATSLMLEYVMLMQTHDAQGN
jgi:hypothetical protein